MFESLYKISGRWLWVNQIDEVENLLPGVWGCPRISNSLESPFDKGGLRGIWELRGLTESQDTADG